MLLLDTHVLIWTFGNSARLTDRAKQAMLSDDLFISIATLWEIGIKCSLSNAKKRLVLDRTVQEIADMCDTQGIEILPITPRDCELLGTLPHIHEDPFDRMLIAQAQNRGLTLVTKDENIWKYPEIDCVW